MPETISLKGRLTDEGVECQALRTDADALYTLVGDLKGFRTGDAVAVRGTVAEMSFCMQGTTVQVEWIGPADSGVEKRKTENGKRKT